MSTTSENRLDYTVLARRFRPQAFAEVVGQENVAQALRNAIEAGRVAHAYLFTGARGVGKTSMARILAKSLNCPNVKDGNPCNACEICDGVSTGSDVDVLEIDGASNRGIDDIRSLRANVNVKSMRSRYKIYIIDEVHMLTKEAFNALLKTLEEPPPGVKFVFCTTEPNKLPDTILSRCQRFDFGTIRTSEILTRLEQIATAEGRIVEPQALQLVARRAAGSMRDSQSLFDQVLAFGSQEVTVADVHRLLGTAPDSRLIEMMDAVIAKQRDVVLERLNQAVNEGVQLGELTDQLLAYVRDLMVLATEAGGVPLASVAEEHRPHLDQQAKQWGLRTVVAAVQILAECKARMQRVNYSRALAEVALIRLSLLEDLDDLAALVQQLSQGPGSGGSLPGSTPERRPATSTKSPVSVPPSRSSRGNSPPRAESDSPALSVSAEYGEMRGRLPSEDHHLVDSGASGPGKSEVSGKKGVSVQSEPLPTVELAAGCEEEFVAQMISRIQDTLRDHVRAAIPSAISGPNHLALGFTKRYDFPRSYCEQPAVLTRLTKIASEVAGCPVRVSVVRCNDPVEVQPVQETIPTVERTKHPIDIEGDLLVQQTLASFGGMVVKTDRFERDKLPKT